MLIEVPGALGGGGQIWIAPWLTQEGKAGELGCDFSFLHAVNEYRLTLSFLIFHLATRGHSPLPGACYEDYTFKV